MPKNRPLPADVQKIVLDAARAKKPRTIKLTLDQYREIGHQRSASQAIRNFCLDCVGGSRVEVERCTSVGCDLFLFRFGASAWVDDEARERTVA